MFSLWSAAVCFPNLRRAFATQVAYTFRPEEGKGVLQQQGSYPLVSARGVSASERMIEPGCLGAVPKWMETTGFRPLCGPSGRKIQQDLSSRSAVQQCGRGESQVGFIYDRDGDTLCVVTGRKADDQFSKYPRQYTQEEMEREKDSCAFF